MADLSLTATPIIAFIAAYLQLTFVGQEALNTALGMSILIISFPVHAYFLLGKVAEERLPIGLQSWYREIEKKLRQGQPQVEIEPLDVKTKYKSNSKLTYFDLALLLKRLFESENTK